MYEKMFCYITWFNIVAIIIYGVAKSKYVYITY